MQPANHNQLLHHQSTQCIISSLVFYYHLTIHNIFTLTEILVVYNVFILFVICLIMARPYMCLLFYNTIDESRVRKSWVSLKFGVGWRPVDGSCLLMKSCHVYHSNTNMAAVTWPTQGLVQSVGGGSWFGVQWRYVWGSSKQQVNTFIMSAIGLEDLHMFGLVSDPSWPWCLLSTPLTKILFYSFM